MSRDYPSLEKLQEKQHYGECPSYAIVIADDDVGVITPPRVGGFAFIICNGSSDTPQGPHTGMVYFDVGSSLSIYEGAFGSIGSAFVVSTSDVTGTTGTDGNTTVAVQAGVIKIENRSGATRTYQITFM